MYANTQSDQIRLLLKPDEAARALAISERTLWSMTKQGTIPSVRLNRSVRYDPDTLRTWIANQMQKPQKGITHDGDSLAPKSN